ncbi:helix-turn-helix transcriptional regulator [Kangiella spongicola]|uniref:Transcriptional regulator n=1 Tax=Kangiella spongicola TaxID=796379 RepID=A0A318D7P0_9GAMM|nr:helix-turn-helix transcriptional regulator [Kangiella spongicola]PXF63214.1 transcriptional regulator [Kangiella spongicola]
MQADQKYFANNLKVLRAQHNYTQADLAELVGVTRKTINTIENRIFIPSAFLALKLAKAFELTVEDIFYIEKH